MVMMTIAGREYPVIGYEPAGSHESVPSVPLVDIPMMSDETWIKISQESAVHNYEKVVGKRPESVSAALEWQSAWVADAERRKHGK